MIKGYITNNTGHSRHIFQRTIYPGGTVMIEDIYGLLANKVPEGQKFETWLKGKLPEGWEVSVHEELKPLQPEEVTLNGQEMFKEVLTAVPVVVDVPKKVEISKEFSTPRQIDKMSAKDIYDLRLKDNPKRILKNVFSIHKLRRALALCKNDNRKTMLERILKGRIRELNVTL